MENNIEKLNSLLAEAVADEELTKLNEEEIAKGVEEKKPEEVSPSVDAKELVANAEANGEDAKFVEKSVEATEVKIPEARKESAPAEDTPSVKEDELVDNAEANGEDVKPVVVEGVELSENADIEHIMMAIEYFTENGYLITKDAFYECINILADSDDEDVLNEEYSLVSEYDLEDLFESVSDITDVYPDLDDSEYALIEGLLNGKHAVKRAKKNEDNRYYDTRGQLKVKQRYGDEEAIKAAEENEKTHSANTAGIESHEKTGAERIKEAIKAAKDNNRKARRATKGKAKEDFDTQATNYANKDGKALTNAELKAYYKDRKKHTKFGSGERREVKAALAELKRSKKLYVKEHKNDYKTKVAEEGHKSVEDTYNTNADYIKERNKVLGLKHTAEKETAGTRKAKRFLKVKDGKNKNNEKAESATSKPVSSNDDLVLTPKKKEEPKSEPKKDEQTQPKEDTKKEYTFNVGSENTNSGYSTAAVKEDQAKPKKKSKKNKPIIKEVSKTGDYSDTEPKTETPKPEQAKPATETQPKEKKSGGHNKKTNIVVKEVSKTGDYSDTEPKTETPKPEQAKPATETQPKEDSTSATTKVGKAVSESFDVEDWHAILRESDYVDDDENIDILKEGLADGTYELVYEEVPYSDDELREILRENDYMDDDENLAILREGLDSNELEIVYEDAIPEGIEEKDPKEVSPEVKSDELVDNSEANGEEVKPVCNDDCECCKKSKLDEAIDNLNSFIESLNEDVIPQGTLEKKPVESVGDVKSDELVDNAEANGKEIGHVEIKEDETTITIPEGTLEKKPTEVAFDVKSEELVDNAKANGEDVKFVEGSEEAHDCKIPEARKESAPAEEIPAVKSDDVVDNAKANGDEVSYVEDPEKDYKAPEAKTYTSFSYKSLKEVIKLGSKQFDTDEKKAKLSEQLSILLAKENDDLLYEEYNRLVSEAQAIRTRINQKYSVIAANRTNDLLENMNLMEQKIAAAKTSMFKKLNEQREINETEKNAPRLSADETAFRD